MNLDPQKLLREGKLIVALMSSELDLLDEVQQQLAQIFGACELRGALYSLMPSVHITSGKWEQGCKRGSSVLPA